MTVHVAHATLDAYQPAEGQPRNRFTIAATAAGKSPPPAAPRLHPVGGGIVVDAPNPLSTLLVRVPDGVVLVVDSRQGDVNVTDVVGNVRVRAEHGNVKIFLRDDYAQASAATGNLSVTMGATSWPGTLHFSTGRGDVELWVPQTAAFRVHLHTDDGTLFTDFNLRGTSAGTAETIDGAVNGGGNQGIDIRTSLGSIRLLRLEPQA